LWFAEYYERFGELKPGAKGIALPAEQWQRLVKGMEVLSQQVTGSSS
jgi:hypothetical protein